jgi:hypothetical protein
VSRNRKQGSVGCFFSSRALPRIERPWVRGRVLAVQGFDEVARELGPILVERRLPRPGQPHNSHYEGDGYVLVRHPETVVVERALARLITRVRIVVG